MPICKKEFNTKTWAEISPLTVDFLSVSTSDSSFTNLNCYKWETIRTVLNLFKLHKWIQINNFKVPQKLKLEIKRAEMTKYLCISEAYVINTGK